MAFQVSPGVNVSEIDLTAVVPAVSASVGAIAGVFRWGPVNERVLISNEKQLIQTFGEPTSYFKDSGYTQQWTNHETFFTASNFLNYANALYVVRTTGGTRVQNATMSFASGNPASITVTGASFTTDFRVGDEIEVSDSTANDGYYKITAIVDDETIRVEGLVDADGNQYIISTDAGDAGPASGPVIDSKARAASSSNFSAKYVGRIGNSLAVSFCSTTSGGVSEFAPVASGYTIAISPFVQNQQANPAIVTGPTTQQEAEEFADIGDNVVLSDGTQLKIESISAVQASGGGGTLSIVNTDANTVDSVSDTNLIFSTTGTNTITNDGGVDFQVFEDGETIVITGSSNNDGTYTITGAPTATVITVVEAFSTEETDANNVTITGEPNGSIYLATDTFFIKNHGLTTGDTLVYSDGGGTNDPIEGLDNGETYYAVVVDTNNFKLATSYAYAIAETPVVNLGSFGSNGSGTQTFTKGAGWTAQVTFESIYSAAVAYNSTFSVQWADSGLFISQPKPSHVHVVVRDADGSISGVRNSILEIYEDVSTIPGAVNPDGSTNYLGEILENRSNYITCSNPAALVTVADSVQQDLVLGYDGDDEGEIAIGDLVAGYDLYKDAADVDISLVMQGKARGTAGGVSTVLGNYITNNIAESRKDCVAFVSPDLSDQTVDQIVDFSSTLTGSTYMVVDSGYKYQYDKFNDVYRWIPLNGDVAGLCARTDETRDPWFSPAGFNRGVIKNVVKLRVNPTKAERDKLYLNSVNPVVTQPGSGTILFGDKTFSPIASAFDRINVRRLFIVLEKAISTASKSLLFEFNDEFTRAQFKNLVEPFLREVQGRRGIFDFKVICDETNNTDQVIDANQFVGDIFIKPARAINFIQLNFVAVRTGVEFEEIVGSV